MGTDAENPDEGSYVIPEDPLFKTLRKATFWGGLLMIFYFIWPFIDKAIDSATYHSRCGANEEGVFCRERLEKNDASQALNYAGLNAIKIDRKIYKPYPPHCLFNGRRNGNGYKYHFIAKDENGAPMEGVISRNCWRRSIHVIKTKTQRIVVSGCNSQILPTYKFNPAIACVTKTDL